MTSRVVGLVLLVAVALGAAAQDQPRLALIVGNADYEHFGTLRNPGNDARDISAALSELGFDVTTVLDADYRTLFSAIRGFGDRLAREPGIGLFYYAGHAIEAGGVNYLIPTDADIRAQDEVEFASIAVDLVLSKMETAGNPTNIVVLDSCRDNPLPETARRGGGGRGLSVVEAPRGSLIVYATEPGSTAADGEGRNSPFTSAFLEHVATPGLDVELMLRNVRRDVISATGGRQTPWSNSSLTESVVLAGADTGIGLADTAAASVAVRREVGSLRISTRDPGDIYIDGELVVSLRKDERVTLENIPAGTRAVEIRFDGHREAREVTLAEDDLREVSFTYEADPRFTLVVDPGLDGLEVTVDGRTVGRTPLELEAAAGTRSIELEGDYIRPVSGRVSGESRETVRWEPEVVPHGRLRIDGDLPRNTRVLVDGEETAYWNAWDKIPVGSHRISIVHETLKDNATTVSIRYGETTTIRPSLEYRTGTVRVSGVPAGATVVIGGAPASVRDGVAGAEKVIGTYPVEISNRYGVSYRRTVQVAEDRTAGVTLEPATVTFTGAPAESTLSLNGVAVALRDGGASVELLPGRYEAALSGAWISDEQQTITVAAGASRTVTFDPARYGRLSISADEDAVVEIDGSSVDGAVRLPTGSYSLRARLRDDVGWSHEARVDVVYGRTTQLDLTGLEYSVAYRVRELGTQRSVLQEELTTVTGRRRVFSTAGWVSLGAGVVGTGLSVWALLLGDQAHRDYMAAQDTASAAAARDRVERAGIMLGIGGSLGGVGISVGPLMLLFRPDAEDTQEQIRRIDAQIRTLEE